MVLVAMPVLPGLGRIDKFEEGIANPFVLVRTGKKILVGCLYTELEDKVGEKTLRVAEE